jgi:NDP-sugar pyrophosphorylase family protein
MMDAVVLAAGKGSRLNGVMLPFHKPLFLINGRPLITQIVDILCGEGEVERIIIVVAPENAQPIAQILDGYGNLYHMVVQPYPSGPGEALLRGLQLVHSERVLVLMGDNTISQQEIHDVTRIKRDVISTQHLPSESAQRFTYYSNGEWYEDHQVTPGQNTLVWCGPLVLRSERVREAIPWVGRSQEVKIGPYLNDILDGDDYECYESSALDIGTP